VVVHRRRVLRGRSIHVVVQPDHLARLGSALLKAPCLALHGRYEHRGEAMHMLVIAITMTPCAENIVILLRYFGWWPYLF
jgi:hypothetical protein